MSYITGTFGFSTIRLYDLRNAYANTLKAPILNMSRKQTIAQIRELGYNRVALQWYQSKGQTGHVSRLILVTV